MATCGPTTFGANPANIKWNIVRGDTSPLRIEFYEPDEVTLKSTTGWTYVASSYDYKGDVIDELEVSPGDGYVLVTASPDITKYWGTGYSSIVAELAFDLQVTLPNGNIWTPVLGTISVLGDVTGGSL